MQRFDYSERFCRALIGGTPDRDNNSTRVFRRIMDYWSLKDPNATTNQPRRRE